MWVLLYVASRNFQYKGNFRPRMFDEHIIPAPKCLYQGPTGGLSKSLWLTGFYTISFPCAPLQAFFDSSREFHRKREEKARLARVRRRKEYIEDLQRYFDETKADLDSLLDTFDTILHDETADWSHGVIWTPILDPAPAEPSAEPPVAPEQPPPLPSPPRNKRRQQDPKEENSRPAKRTRRDRDENAETAKPLKKRATPSLPRRVYNLRPRKKPGY